MKRLTPILVPLKGHDSFKRVLGKATIVRTNNFLGAFVPNTSIIVPVSFGISVPKRHAKKAVVRNRTKILIKKSLISLAQNEKEKLLTFEEFVLIRTVKLPSHPKFVRLDEVKSEIFSFFYKAVMRIGQNNETHTNRID